MTGTEIDELLLTIGPAGCCDAALTETHISWVILAGGDAYKIKKPVSMSFLDFTTLEKRKYFCERELALNKRLTKDIYLDVLPVRKAPDGLNLDGSTGEVIDYAVHMRRMDDHRRMDKLLKENAVTLADIDRLAQKIADFHRTAKIIHDKAPRDIPDKFDDLAAREKWLRTQLTGGEWRLISPAIHMSEAFFTAHGKRIKERIAKGYTRDGHGDLHARNIFLLDEPQPFDCIEFNDDLRQTDVLNEIAFLCMDLDAFDKTLLAKRFTETYRSIFPIFETPEDEQLFIYYKSYRANVRAKVNCFRAASARTDPERTVALAEAARYLSLMDTYIRKLY